MNLICEMDLVDLGSICGVIGGQNVFRRDQFMRMLLKTGCTGIMFCFSGEDDLAIAEAVKQFTGERRQCRSIMIYNPSILCSLKTEAQVYLEKLLDQVDMVLLSQWSIEELQVAVAIHCEQIIVVDPTRATQLAGILNEIDYQGKIVCL